MTIYFDDRPTLAETPEPLSGDWQKLLDAILAGWRDKPHLHGEVRRIVAEFAARADVSRRAA
jgi:hypothetical protein